MNVFQGKLSKEALLNIPKAERNNFIAVAHMQNEIRFCLYGVIWSHDFSSNIEAVVHGQLALNFFYLKTLAGKLNEGWEFLQKSHFKNKVLSTGFSETAENEALALLRELKRYFSGNNVINEIRNSHAFHYSPDELGEKLADLPEELDLYISKDNDANTLYYLAEALANQRVVDRLNLGEYQNPLDAIYSEIIGVAKIFKKFNMLYLKHFIKKYNPEIWECPVERVEFDILQEFSKVSVPFFTDTSKGLIQEYA
jgi:hypothetical protein